MRLYISIISALAMFFATTVASATIFVTISNVTLGGVPVVGTVIVGPNNTDLLEFDISLFKDNDSNVGAFGLSLFGYDLGPLGPTGDIVGLSTGSTSAVGLFARSNFESIGSPNDDGMFRAVTDNLGTPTETCVSCGPNFVRLFAVFNTATNLGKGDGTVDDGADGLVGGPHAHIIMQLTGLAGQTNLTVGLSEGDAATDVAGAQIPLVTDSLSILAIPEPGTALLMALGLAGLSAAGRRK